MDLIKTLDEDEAVDNFSEDSDSGAEDAQPVKKALNKRKSHLKADKDFDPEFSFSAGGNPDYAKDTWSDLAKYLKKKAKTTLDDKIAKVRGEMVKNEEGQDEDEDDDDDDDLSEDELVHDDVKIKAKDAERKKRKKLKSGGQGQPEVTVEDEEAEDFFEEAVNDYDVSFHSMNLSRPLLKAIEVMRFVHPTPIQSRTIPVALAGRDVCGCAATGTGKTAAYVLPVLERLLYRPKEQNHTRVLILVPTRELGVQVQLTLVNKAIGLAKSRLINPMQ